MHTAVCSENMHNAMAMLVQTPIGFVLGPSGNGNGNGRTKIPRVLLASAAMHGRSYFDVLPADLLAQKVTQLLLDPTPVERDDFQDFIAICNASSGLKRLLLTLCTRAQLDGYETWSLKWRLMKSLHQKLASNHWAIDNQVCSVIACSKNTGQWIPAPEPGHGPYWGMTCSSVYGSLSVIEALAERVPALGHHCACRCIFPSMVPRHGFQFVTCSKKCFHVADAMLKELMTNPTHVRATRDFYPGRNLPPMTQIDRLSQIRRSRLRAQRAHAQRPETQLLS